MGGERQLPGMEALPEDYADPEEYEYRVKCEETCHRGPVNFEDARAWWRKHERKGHDVTVYVREKQRPMNDSDYDEMLTVTCDRCDSVNIPGQVFCAVCGGPVNEW